VRNQVLTGVAYVAVGLAASMAGWRWASWRPIALAAAVVLVPWGVYAALAPMSLDAYPTTYARSPVPYTSSSVSSGQRLFAEHCAVCHGARGRGDGPAADSLLQRPADLAAPHTGDHTPGDIFWWITNGLGLAMPAFGDRLTVGERWELISFVRTLASVERARTLTAAVEVGGKGPVAPDFAFSAGGVTRRLRDVVRHEPVLLVLFTASGSSGRLSELSHARADLARAGALVVAVPRDGGDGAAASADGLPVVRSEEAPSVAGAYELFASADTRGGAVGNPAGSAHAELLIDKAGYLRARWIPGEPGRGWADIARLSKEIRILRDEAAREPAPADLE
jgi:putative copper resistance protein D